MKLNIFIFFTVPLVQRLQQASVLAPTVAVLTKLQELQHSAA